MYLYFDFGSEDSFSRDFIQVLLSGFSPAELEFFSSLNSLQHRVRKSVFDIQMTIIYVPDVGKVSELLGEKDLLRQIPVIIVLNQGLKEAEKELHDLHPRLISRAEYGIMEVYSILKKVQGQARKGPPFVAQAQTLS
jgi:hypothetical protein